MFLLIFLCFFKDSLFFDTFKTENKALFSVTARNAFVYLTLEVSSVLHGPSEVFIDPYLKMQEVSVF